MGFKSLPIVAQRTTKGAFRLGMWFRTRINRNIYRQLSFQRRLSHKVSSIKLIIAFVYKTFKSTTVSFIILLFLHEYLIPTLLQEVYDIVSLDGEILDILASLFQISLIEHFETGRRSLQQVDSAFRAHAPIYNLIISPL